MGKIMADLELEANALGTAVLDATVSRAAVGRAQQRRTQIDPYGAGLNR